MIGDSIWDIKAASRAGVAAIGLLSGGTDRESLLREGAVEVYDDVADLLRHLDDRAVAQFFPPESQPDASSAASNSSSEGQLNQTPSTYTTGAVVSAGS
jgi:hypothetical protein